MEAQIKFDAEARRRGDMQRGLGKLVSAHLCVSAPLRRR